MTNIEEIKNLKPDKFLQRLVEFNESYYAGNPQITDSEYDQLEEIFRNKYPELVDQLPVGTTLDEFEKVEHPTYMGSLPKIESESQVQSWIDEHVGENVQPVFQPKFDGCAVELIYQDGELEYMLTRGNGNEGEDVTHIAKILDHIPNLLDIDTYPELGGTLILRGEAVLYKDDHPNEARRNLATGTLKSLDSTKSVERNLKVYIHTFVESVGGFSYNGLESDLQFLGNQGFLVSPVFYDIQDYSDPSWMNVPYDVDGVVVKPNTGPEPLDAVAYKFPEETKYTKVIGISYQLGRTKKISPVLEVETVEIDNRELENVSLGSYEILDEANIGVGDTVEVTFANDIIPHLESVVERTDSERFELTECPKCEGEVQMDGSHIYCQNQECGTYIHTRFRSMVHSMGVDGLGGTKVGDLGDMYNWDFSELIRDITGRSSPPEKWRRLDGWGSKTTRSIWSQMVETIEGLTYYRLFSILSLDGFGYKTRKKYLRANADNPYPLTKEKLLNASGVQNKTATKIIESFEERKEVAETLIEIGPDNIELGVRTEERDLSGPLEGIEVFVTGSLEYGTRPEFKGFLRDHGGEYNKSESAILVTNDKSSTSNKAQYARDNDCQIMTENEFLCEFGLEDEVDWEIETESEVELTEF